MSEGITCKKKKKTHQNFQDDYTEVKQLVIWEWGQRIDLYFSFSPVSE